MDQHDPAAARLDSVSLFGDVSERLAAERASCMPQKDHQLRLNVGEIVESFPGVRTKNSQWIVGL
jgi:hypothetical protein